MSQDDGIALLNETVRNRGYVLDYHRLMAKYDPAIMRSINDITQDVYKTPRLLDEKTKELLFVLSMTCLRVSPAQIGAHVKLAIEAGASPEEVLETIELAIPEAGIPTFMHGLMAWADAVGAQGLEPTVSGYIGGPDES